VVENIIWVGDDAAAVRRADASLSARNRKREDELPPAPLPVRIVLLLGKRGGVARRPT
jgi:hypothetical protein